ncbi:hypothetical protein PFDG_05270 [Plasmodium falciparum Dd2]|uniref:Uncharacterized protein n=1 Tax=Plasmodium falciparum (isolate Dd2) TaxID=57267 RepID=A0A0L7MA33_PLAF4|nr:hypothetical protein PFDG_05270 [Plasmodium falciparum Dd2]
MLITDHVTYLPNISRDYKYDLHGWCVYKITRKQVLKVQDDDDIYINSNRIYYQKGQ